MHRHSATWGIRPGHRPRSRSLQATHQWCRCRNRLRRAAPRTGRRPKGQRSHRNNRPRRRRSRLTRQPHRSRLQPPRPGRPHRQFGRHSRCRVCRDWSEQPSLSPKPEQAIRKKTPRSPGAFSRQPKNRLRRRPSRPSLRSPAQLARWWRSECCGASWSRGFRERDRHAAGRSRARRCSR